MQHSRKSLTLRHIYIVLSCSCPAYKEGFRIGAAKIAAEGVALMERASTLLQYLGPAGLELSVLHPLTAFPPRPMWDQFVTGML